MTKKQHIQARQYAKFELTKYAIDHAEATPRSPEWYATREEIIRAANDIQEHDKAANK